MTNPDLNLSVLPEMPGVYLMYDFKDKIIYVGKAINLKNRVRSYFQNRDQGEKVRAMVSNIERFDYIVTDNEVEALMLESTLIKKFKPKYNIMLKDDKELPYLKITLKDNYPQLIPARKMYKDGSKYYGPYPTLSVMYEVKNLVERMFPVKSCDVPVYKDRPCLYYHMKKCLAPCISWVSTEQHQKMIKEVCLFLEGKTGNLLEKLKEEMEDSAERLDFERAAELRDSIKSLTRYTDKQKVVTSPGIDQDFIGFFSEGENISCQVFQIRDGKLIGKIDFYYPLNGNTLEDFSSTFITEYYQKTDNIPSEIIMEIKPTDQEIIEAWLNKQNRTKVKITLPQKGQKKDLLEMVNKNASLYLDRLKSDHSFMVSKNGVLELKKALGLPFLPLRIEGFDISHMQGKHTVASMVVFENGKPKKSDYRKFKINFAEGEPNDFASMYEVVYRRYKRVKEEDLEVPELILIDGGKGQLNAALKALSDLDFNYKGIIGLAKRLEEIFLPGEKTSIMLPENSFGLKLVQNVRDEAHRFAITFHRSLREKNAVKSFLDDIKGIGKARKKQLMEKFESMDKLYELSLKEMIEIGKLPKKTAEELYNKLKES